MHTNQFPLYNAKHISSRINADPCTLISNSEHDISEEYNWSTYGSMPCQVILPSPWHHLFTINPTLTPLFLASHLHLCCILLSALVPLILLPCIITTIFLSLLQTLLFSTCINTPCMYQYSLSLILNLFLSYSFLISVSQLVIPSLPQTSTPTLNPSYAVFLHIFDSLTLDLVFHSSQVFNIEPTLHLSTPCYGTSWT